MRIVPVPGTRVLPQTQAGFAPWSSPALCRETKLTWEPRAAKESANSGELSEMGVQVARSSAGEAEHRDARKRISAGARAVNRLLMSLWFLLVPLMWPSSDWIGLIILSQAFLVAANLIRPAFTLVPAAALPESAPLNINNGDGSGKG